MATKDVLLSTSIRNNLLTLNATQKAINRTQTRLSTGRDINSAVDDAVRYFQSKGLDDRAADLKDRKIQMQQGVESLTTVSTALDSMQEYLKTMKGVISQARSATASERAGYANTLKQNVSDINNNVNDASYQGLNLLNSSASVLRIQFSEKITSEMRVQGVDFTSTGTLYRNSIGNVAKGGDKVSLAGAGNPVGPGQKGTNILGYLGFGGWAKPIVSIKGYASNVIVASVAGKASAFKTPTLSGYDFDKATDLAAFIAAADIANMRLDATINAVKSQAASIGNYISVLKIRINFTEDYTSILKSGATELVATDMNEEGANSLALTTRQQLGIQALSFAGQSEQSVLQLFR